MVGGRESKQYNTKLGVIAKVAFKPVKGNSSDTIPFKFSKQDFMINLIKRFAEIQIDSDNKITIFYKVYNFIYASEQSHINAMLF